RAWRGAPGKAIVLAGSCSRATREQIGAHTGAGRPAFKVTVADVLEGNQTPASSLDWARGQTGLPLVFSSSDPNEVATAQQRFGRARSAETLEAFFGRLA